MAFDDYVNKLSLFSYSAAVNAKGVVLIIGGAIL